MARKVKSLSGYSDCLYAPGYIVVHSTIEEFESVKSTDLVLCDVWVGETVLQNAKLIKYQVNCAKKQSDCVQFFTD